MNRTIPPTVGPHEIWRTFLTRPARWVLPMLLCTSAAVAFALFRPKTWEASQALLVRSEISLDGKQGANSTRADDTKAAQETVLELVYSQKVLDQALAIVGPNAEQDKPGFPTARDAEDLAELVKLVPPKGGEFGKTDIFYLKVQDHERSRALELARVISQRLQARYEELRESKAASLIQELEKTVALARKELEQVTAKLSETEREVGGADLGELRIMNELPSGMSDLRNESFAIESELRKEMSEQIQNQQLLQILKAALVDPGELIACPNNLLNAQPGLKRLKDGMVDAQIKSATLLGTMAPDHPQVVAAQEVAEQIGVSLHEELAVAIRAITADLQLSQQRIARLEQQKSSLRARFDHLASIRASYGNLSAMAKHRGEILKSAELELADARSKQAAAHTGTLLQIIGDPTTGTRPVGPGRTTIVLAGTLGGFIIGLGLIVLTAKPQYVEPEVTSRVIRVEPIVEAPVAAAVVVPAAAEPPQEAPKVLPQEVPQPEPHVSQPAIAAKATPAPVGPLSFRQALERIASVKGGPY